LRWKRGRKKSGVGLVGVEGKEPINGTGEFDSRTEGRAEKKTRKR